MLFTLPPDSFHPAKKIISLVPSITELLWYLGLEQETIGITKFCVHPTEWLKEKKRIGGTKNIHVEEVISLQPELVIASREENVKEQVEEIARYSPVFLTDVVTINDAFKMIADVGVLTGKHNRAMALVESIKEKFLTLPASDLYDQDAKVSPTFRISSIYLIWKDPYMTIGGDTFISNMMRAAGFKNVYAHQDRYPEISIDELKNSDAELIMLSSEPYPFKQSHVEELSLLLPGKKVVPVDGELFSWYGSRMLEAPNYFKHLRELLAAH